MEYPCYEQYSRTLGTNTGATSAEPSTTGPELGVTGLELGPKQLACRASKPAR
jgi:hypothetical protein